MKIIFSLKNRFYLVGAVFVIATVLALIFNSVSDGQSIAATNRNKVLGATNTNPSSFAVLVKDNEREWRGSTTSVDLKEILKNLQVPLYPEDLVNIFPDPKLKIGTTITINRAPIIYLKDGLGFIEMRSWSKNVSEFLNEKNIILGPLDQLNPTLSTILANKTTIIITRIGERDEVIEEVIDFQKIEKTTSDMYKGERKIEQKGMNGKKIKTFRLRYENNQLVSKILINEEIIEKSQPQITLVGIRPKITVRCRYNSTVEEASAKYGIDANSLCRTMMCESNGNANSVGYCGNPSEPCYFGLFQYTQGLWSLISPKAGYSGANIFNPVAQIFTTSWAWSHGYRGRWPNC